MSDLIYASIVILIIWAGIFFWVFGLDRRLRRLERTVQSRSGEQGESTPDPALSESAQETITAGD